MIKSTNSKLTRHKYKTHITTYEVETFVILCMVKDLRYIYHKFRSMLIFQNYLKEKFKIQMDSAKLYKYFGIKGKSEEAGFFVF